MNKTDMLKNYQERLTGKTPREMIAWAFETFGVEKVVLASSLGAEDQVLTEMAATTDPHARVLTLDTGRLFAETYNLIQETNEKYGIRIDLIFPAAGEVEELVRKDGPNLFYLSVENRRRCCAVRKVHPLKRALAGSKAWICGLRRGQSASRETVEPIVWDAEHNLYKICPLFDWTEKAVWDYLKAHGVPFHALHDKGFPSIGCAPCTRAVQPGADVRSGRWWWEKPEHKECGLHSPAD